MTAIILSLHFVVCAFLIGTILLQAGKGADIGAAFGAGGSQTVFGPRGATTILHKVTIAAAAIFLLTSIFLTYQTRQASESVLEELPAAGEAVPPPVPVEEPVPAPAEPTP